MSVRYRLLPCCRVRQEDFGLLFYDSRGPRLLFAETGALLGADELRAGVSSADLERRIDPVSAERIRSLLKRLAAKGFLHEQSVC